MSLDKQFIIIFVNNDFWPFIVIFWIICAVVSIAYCILPFVVMSRMRKTLEKFDEVLGKMGHIENLLGEMRVPVDLLPPPEPKPLPATWATCLCNTCSKEIGFDPAQSGNIIVCPHCGIETRLYVPETASSTGA